MPNYFKPPTQQPLSIRKTLSTTDVATPLAKGELGLLHSLRVRAGERKGHAAVRLAKVEAATQEAMATVVAAARMQGAELRAEAARVHATTLGAIATEVVKNQQAVHFELASTRFSGSLANIDNRRDMIDAVRKRTEARKISAEDADALAQTAFALHQEVEERIDAKYQAAANQIDTTFDLATRSAKSILENGK